MTSKRLGLICVLVIYGAILFRLMVFKGIDVETPFIMIKLDDAYQGEPNFIPFRTILPYLLGRKGLFISFVELFGNVVPLAPIGLLASLLFRRMTWSGSFALGIAVGLAIETTQAVFHVGIFDVDDILLNALGVVIGHAMVRRHARTGGANQRN